MAIFTKESGNSMRGVDMIAVIRPNRVAYQKDKDGKTTDKISAQFVDVMVDNSTLSADDIKAGKGQANPNLYSRSVSYKDKETGETKTGYNNGIRFAPSQVEAIKNVGKENALTTEDGTMYVPFKADLMYLKENVTDKQGQVVMGENGKPQKRNVGFLPNTETLTASENGPLTQERLAKHFENTKAVNAEKDAKKAPEAEVQAEEKPAAKKTTAKRTRKSKLASVSTPSAEQTGAEMDTPECPF